MPICRSINGASKGIQTKFVALPKAQWDKGRSSKHTLYILNRSCILPELFLSEQLEQETNALNDMNTELSINDFDINDLSAGYRLHIDSKKLGDTQDNAWHEGVFVEDKKWVVLKDTATAILVENSEQSIKGAG